MSCPTCEHTMQMIFNAANHKAWMCPRCGTLKDDRMGHEGVAVPKLVTFIRDFYRMIDDTGAGNALRSFARISGIEEAIFVPAARSARPTQGE